jgi:hypothetical protein
MVREKYREYGITETPYVVVKADAGTYGMGVMTVRDADEVIALNRRQRNKMSVVKEGLEVSEVIIQEGVHSFETLNGAVAEPVIYMIDRYVVGGFYRVHTGRGKDENLNAPGHALRAAGVHDRLQPSRLQLQQPRCPAQPLLRLRRGRPPGLPGRRPRTRTHAGRPRQRVTRP